MSAVIGIDPGLTGWVVAVDSDGVAWSVPMPRTPVGLAGVLSPHHDLPVVVEVQHPVRGQGLGSTFRIGQGYGQILGVLAGLGIDPMLVRAVDWQRVMLAAEPRLAGETPKDHYVRVARSRWPTIGFCGPRGGIWDGKAAAAMIAAWGWEVLYGC